MPHVLVDLLSYTGTKGGMETYTRELYGEFGRNPDEFTFVGLASSELMAASNSWFPGDLVDSGISGENRIAWARGELFAVSRWADRLGADLIHCPATLGPMRSKVPTVLTMHDMLYFSHPEFMSTPLYTRPVRWMEKRAAANASRILTDSEGSAAEIRKYLRFPADRLQVVPLAGTPQMEQGVDSSPRRTDLVIAIGNRRPHKNFEGLVRAMALIPEDSRPHLIVTGSRGDDPLRPIVESHRLEPWVELKQWITDQELAGLYSTATMLAFPSFAEGFGLPVLDAMAVGLPVVASDIPVIREAGGDAAIYFDASSDRAIAEAIARVAGDPTLQSALADRGRTQAARFTWAKVARETSAGFRVALANPRSAIRRRS